MLRTTREPFTAGHAAPRRAVRGPAVGCAARGAAFCFARPACLPPRPKTMARAVDPDASRRARTRRLMDTSHLLILRNPYKQAKLSCAIQTACPIYAYRPRQTKQLYIRCLKSLLRLRSAETARVTSRYIESYEEW